MKPYPALKTRAEALAMWLRFKALPVWLTRGRSDEGWFHESLTQEGNPLTPVRRARVQPRQAYSLSLASASGWPGPWRDIARDTLHVFEAAHRLPRGGYATRLNPDGSLLDERPLLYDLSFVLLAYAALGDDRPAEAALAFLDTRKVASGGYVEGDHRPYQSNTLMHLLEAFLVWETVRENAGWDARADDLARLALDRLIDPSGGFIREVYNADWNPAGGNAGRIVEPGHQFFWSHLLADWGVRREEPEALSAARRLFRAGQAGVDAMRGVAVCELDQTLSPTRSTARLWPQTERLKAALILGDLLPDERCHFLVAASEALAAVQTYLTPIGVWGDVMDEAGNIEPGPAPASTLYHLMTAFQALTRASTWV